jgi:hypothetical protein
MMPVEIEWHGNEFEREFYIEVGKEVTRASHIFQRRMSDVLSSMGQSPPPSPEGSMIPYIDTGRLANSWMVERSRRRGGEVIAIIFTTVAYAFWLIVREGKGKRDYMNEDLYWYQATMRLIEKRLNAQYLINAALRNMR